MYLGTVTIGTVLGLSAAACQALSYLFSRHFTSRTGNPPLLLLVVAHLLMGVAALTVLVVLRPTHLPPFSSYVLPLAGASLFCLAAQLGLFHLLTTIESSRVAPLLGTKVLVLAALSVVFTRTSLHPLQWLAVLLCTVSAWLLNEAGGRIPARAAGLLALMVISYCLSDLSIGVLVQRLANVTPFPYVVASSLTYVMLGVAILPWAVRADVWRPRTWAMAAPFAATWFIAMCLLFGCFGLIGVVYGNVVQALRGIIAVGLGWIVARIGHAHLESRVSRRVFWRRVAGAVLMTAAVILYRLAAGDSRH
jgi:hypothetical protein